MAQRYADPTAAHRMAHGLCPECGDPPVSHGGAGSARCSLTDSGVASRIRQHEMDSTATPARRPPLGANETPCGTCVRMVMNDRMVPRSEAERVVREWGNYEGGCG